MAQREKPNILLTGTPGTGKTTTAEAIAVSIDKLMDTYNIFDSMFLSEGDRADTL